MCDERLLKIRVPDCISRVPKSLEEIAYWKGNNKLLALCMHIHVVFIRFRDEKLVVILQSTGVEGSAT